MVNAERDCTQNEIDGAFDVLSLACLVVLYCNVRSIRPDGAVNTALSASVKSNVDICQ